MTAESVASGLTAPQSHHGICEVCQEPTVWCMAGYWVHEADQPWDHQAASEDPHIIPAEDGSDLQRYDGRDDA